MSSESTVDSGLWGSRPELEARPFLTQLQRGRQPGDHPSTRPWRCPPSMQCGSEAWDFQAVGPPGLYLPVARRALATRGRLPWCSLEVLAQTLQAPQKIPGPQ